MDDNCNFFWIGDELTNIGILSIKSFIKNGYNCILWCYNKPINTPDNIKIKDANIITPYLEVSSIIFSDYFRYKLLYNTGELWSDLDVICLRKLPSTEYLFVSYKNVVNNFLMRSPKHSDILLSIINDIETNIFNNDTFYNFKYLKNKILEYNLTNFIVDEYLFTSIDKSDIYKISFEEFDWNYPNNYTIHLFNSLHRTHVKNGKYYQSNLNKLNVL